MDIKDEELENELKKRNSNNESISSSQEIIPKFAKTQFATQMEGVKEQLLDVAKKEDDNFVEVVTHNLKQAAISNSQVELEKQELEKSQVQTEQKKEERAQTQVEHRKQEDIWENRRKKRQYHYDGVKPIMSSVGINEPMNLLILYGLTFILVWFFLIGKLWSATIGALICGATDGNRPKAMKGFIWTVLGLLLVLVVAGGVYLFLEWKNII